MGFLSFLPIIGHLFTTIDGINKSIANERLALIAATTDREKAERQERIDSLKQRRDVMVEESRHSNANMYVRAGLALPVILIVWKLLAWDKALGQWTGGHTDKLSPLDIQLIMAVVGFYLLFETAGLFKRK